MSTHDTLIASDTGFSVAEQALLRTIADTMIPPDPDTGAPGAGEERICAEVFRTLSANAESTRQALDLVQRLAGGDFRTLDGKKRVECLDALRRGHSRQATLLVSAVLQCYYRDDQVMQLLDMEPRPPFPKGFEVPDGDRSLLDPVKARKPFWQPAPG